LIKDFRKKGDKPLLKGAYIDEAIFVGDNQLDALVNLKSPLRRRWSNHCRLA
jgi:large subunit ribosomal protein L10